MSLAQVWAHFAKNLLEVFERYEARVLAFVLMPNHYHLLMRTPHANLGEVLNYLLRETSQAVGRGSGRVNHIFGGRNKTSLITEDAYFANAYKYVYLNPVAASLCSKVEDYRYSTFRSIVNGEKLPFPVFDGEAADLGGLSGMRHRLEWMNTDFTKNERLLIKRGLRRAQFILSKDRKYAKVVERLTNPDPFRTQVGGKSMRYLLGRP